MRTVVYRGYNACGSRYLDGNSVPVGKGGLPTGGGTGRSGLLLDIPETIFGLPKNGLPINHFDDACGAHQIRTG